MWETSPFKFSNKVFVITISCLCLWKQNVWDVQLVTPWPQGSGVWCLIKSCTSALITETISPARFWRIQDKNILWRYGAFPSHCMGHIVLLSACCHRLVEAIGSPNQIMGQLILGAWLSGLSFQASQSLYKFRPSGGGELVEIWWKLECIFYTRAPACA